MGKSDQDELAEELRQSTNAVKKAVAGMTDEEAGTKVSPEGWSVLECIEHITLVDQGFSSRLAGAPRLAEPILAPEREAMIRSDVPKRTRRFVSPPQVLPTGKYHSLREALEGLANSRAQMMEIIAAREGELRVLEVQHPVVGAVSGFEAFLLIAAHGVRHANQIEEMRAGVAREDTRPPKIVRMD